MSVKTNERELTAKISEWLNQIIRNNKSPITEVTTETGVKGGKSTKFADIILWKDREAKDAYSYIELKPPFGAIENIDTFKSKALNLGVKFAFTWDFQNLKVYKCTDTTCEYLDTDPVPILYGIDDWLRGDIQIRIKTYLEKIIEELETLHDIGKTSRFYPDKYYFVNFVREAVHTIVPKYDKHVRDAAKDRKKKAAISKYAVNQGIAYPSDDDYYRLIAYQAVYALITKIIFYLTIRRHFDDLPDLYLTDEPDIDKLLRYAFSEARTKDWQAVFVEDPIEELGLPESIYDDIRKLLEELKVYHFGNLSEDVIGELFEEIIDPNERHRLGQFFTNEDLVDLIIGFAVHDIDGYYADPTCGSGTFLIRLYDRLRYLSSNKLKHTDILNKIWGIDIGKFPAELSTINLFRQDVSNYQNFPRVLNENIFYITKGSKYDFPPPLAGKDFDKISIELPEFNAFVGNFPFIRQELIEKKEKGNKQKITKVIAKELYKSNPELFNVNLEAKYKKKLNTANEKEYSKLINNFVDSKNISLKLSGQADIYSYIYLHTSSLMTDKGTFAIITSNSWLDVSYGAVLKRFFLNNFKVKAIIASWVEPWFEDASVNTIVTVLEKGKADDNHIVKFVKLKKKLEELIPSRDLRLESQKRWKTVDGIVDTIESIENHKDTESITEIISSYEDSDYRIRMIKQSELLNELDVKQELAKWGKYLRAPDVYFELLEVCGNKLVPLKTIADVRRGYTTGINEFFYLTVSDDTPSKSNLLKCSNSRGWEGEIEKEYLQPVIKSPKEATSIKIDTTKLKYHIFICNKSKEDLKKAGDTNALSYIEWGEKQRTKNGVKWNEVPSVSGRKSWYMLNDLLGAKIFCSKGINDRFFFQVSEVELISNNRLYNIYPKKKKNEQYLKKILNSTIVFLFLEIESRVNLGDGLVDNGIDSIEEMKVFDKTTLSKKCSLNKLLKRSVSSIFDEVKKKDRKEFDEAVLNALGLDPADYLDRIYKGITEIVNERLELPKMRKKKKTTTKKEIDDNIKKIVIDEVIPKGVKQFPEDFYKSGDFSKLKIKEYSTNGKPLTTKSFFNNFQLMDEEQNVVFTVESEAEAIYAEIASKKEIYIIGIPNDNKVVEEIITNYKKYINELHKDLLKSAQEKTHDYSASEQIVKDIMSEYGLELIQ